MIKSEESMQKQSEKNRSSELFRKPFRKTHEKIRASERFRKKSRSEIRKKTENN